MARRSPDGLYKRGHIWWGWRRKFPGGPLERASTKCRDRKAARLIKAQWERYAADPINYAANQTTLDGAIAMFLADAKRKGLAPPTQEMYESKCAHIARVLDGGRRLNSVVATTWDGYIATREDEGASSHTIKKELIRGFGVLKAAKRRGLYPHDLSTVMPAYSARYVPRTRALTMDELQRLGRELRADRLAHVAFVVATGCRLKESYRATEAHILPEGFVFVDGTKTERARRTIPIAPPLRPFLEFAIRNAPGAMAGPPRDGHGEAHLRANVPHGNRTTQIHPLDPSPMAASAIAPGTQLFPKWHSARRDIHAACRRAGIPFCSWNDLRRTNATLLSEAGVGSDVGARLLGHVDGRMWESVYSQPKPKALQRSLEAAFEDSTATAQLQLESRALPAKKAESAAERPGLRSRRSEVRILCGALEKHDSSRKADVESSAESAEMAGVPYRAVTAGACTACSHAKAAGGLSGTWHCDDCGKHHTWLVGKCPGPEPVAPGTCDPKHDAIDVLTSAPTGRPPASAPAGGGSEEPAILTEAAARRYDVPCGNQPGNRAPSGLGPTSPLSRVALPRRCSGPSTEPGQDRPASTLFPDRYDLAAAYLRVLSRHTAGAS